MKDYCATCGGSGWVPEIRKQRFQRYTGRFMSTEASNDLMAAIPQHLRVDVPGKAQDAKFSFTGPSESVEVDHVWAIPCADCNQFSRTAYEEGRLGYLLRHREAAPIEDSKQKAKEKWGL